MKNKKLSKAGFTLLEILIAVLIIGVLTTIALPMYQGAVDKSKWARLIAPARAVSTAQEAAFMNYGGYTANIDDLDVSLPEGNDMTYTLYTTTNGDDANFIRITSTQLNDVRLAKYYKNNEGFEDQLYCEARNGNDRANKLCGKLLKGEELVNTSDGYKMYLIDDAITKPLCDKVELWWSNNFTHCYKTEEDRCTANNMPYGSFCGWTNTKDQTINEGGQCVSANGAVYPCQRSIINDGGECVVETGSAQNSCQDATINSGGKCIAGDAAYGCAKPVINDGGQCIATTNRSGCGGGTVNQGGECIDQAGWGCGNSKLYGGTCTTTAGTQYGCRNTTVYEDGVCEGNAGNACQFAKVYDGGKCLGNVNGACNAGHFYEGGVCEGMGAGACGSSSQGTGTFESGSVCNGRSSGSCGSTFQSGSVCNGYTAGACATGNYYAQAIFQSGSTCVAHVEGACGVGPTGQKATFQSGSRCVANVAGACDGNYQEGSCCQGGDNCPANAPRC